MMKVVVKEDAKVLAPNAQHKNFTMTGEVIEKGTQLEGLPKNIEGLRRGESFIYRVFTTNNNKIIFLNKIEPMKTTEVYLGADAAQSATKVNLASAENSTRVKYIAAGIGAVVGFAYSKKKGFADKKLALYTGVGALAGYIVGHIIYNRKVSVKPSK